MIKQKKDANPIQIIAMSATFPNIIQVGKWLDSSVYITEFRPVYIHEYAKIGHEVYNKNGDVYRII